MIVPLPFKRRLISRRFATGSAVFGTFFGVLERHEASAGGAPPLVMVDPGHGGRDPGARGLGGTLEKDVALGAALALRLHLEARGRYQIALTRSEDRFMTPEDRVDMARSRGARLFLSLHADTYPVASVRGASVYTLARRASDPETEALAQRENAASGGRAGVMGPEVSDILSSLAQRETRAISARIAHHLVRGLEREVPVLPSPARHANFMVLQTSGVPSVLIEMGFLSNRADEAALSDGGHQASIARAVTRAIDAWFDPARDAKPG